MASQTAIYGFLRTDAIRLGRDRFVIGTAVYIIAMSVAARWLLPWLTVEVQTRIGFDLTPYLALITSHVIVGLAPLTAGMIGGFLLLDTRESRTVKAMLVAPVPLTAYVNTAAIALFVIAALLMVVEAVIIGIAMPPFAILLAICLAGAPAGAFMALFVAAFADNKTEALAYLKIVGIAPLVPSGAFFLPEPYQWIAAIYPPYWAAKAWWIAQAGGSAWPWWILGGVVMSMLWVAVFRRAFLKAGRR